MLHLQEAVRGRMNMLSDLRPMSGSMEECSQDEHLQRALENASSLLCLSLEDVRPSL